ncbi:hypothetical protein K443DRAFT_116509 [Laccaria amethystina LaAM-08-1]|uniref:CxC2-like cysteine cluster KDZ transposase-associated domain-containing protein n=1 Tax=Laccaria amethystina LaAM-08-1 TaxID=1095629 RepID=A0A0C9WLQ9_9AGAR|nr:hypothetical protein K443DRAFT_116509 [Laccaria amethystina LaAM-08-1]
MAKRKDGEDESQPPSKRLRSSVHVAAARPSDASNPSTSRDASVALNRPGFRTARPRDASRHSVSRITTLAVSASNKRLKAKHIQRRHTPAQAEPAETNLSDDAGLLQPQHEPTKLLEWLYLRDATLDEILRHDGLGDFLGHRHCVDCGQEDGIFKCRDCSGGCLLRCQGCVVKAHQHLPLHRIERWTGEFFSKESLKALGLRVQLGHGGRPCPCPSPGPLGFMVFDTSGVHSVNINYCECPNDSLPDRRTQLLRQEWFPATFTRPNTVFTFDCLDTFHELSLQGKGNLYDFYHSLLRKTDNANISDSIYRYKEMHRVFRIWRNLMILKRAGRGHDPEGIGGTAPGSLTVECPACPHPGRNLPDNWAKAGPLLFLYILYISVDANFKLKGKKRGLKDVELMPGWGPFVEENVYQDFLVDYVDQPEINTCEAEHDAIVRAQTRCTPGYAVSGVGIVICSRHALVRRNGAGDLQKGEKYCNMDFIVFMSLIGVTLPWIFITYDIGCQWSKNFRSRMADFPEDMRIPAETKVEVAIPSWHINGHGEGCRKDFCLGYTKGAGRTCGEEVEITWSHTNALAPSVREMAPAARHDTLNDHWNAWNFRKIVGFRTLFAKRFEEAVLMKAKHTDVFNKFSATFPPAVVEKWERMVVKWEDNPKAANPYNEPERPTTLQDVRLELIREESAKLASGCTPRHKVSMMGFFSMGFDIEDQQFIFKTELSKTKGKKTSKQLADLEEKRSALIHQIHLWRTIQLAYTPHVATLLPLIHDDGNASHLLNPESVPLFFPSSLPASVRKLPEIKEIHDIERRLREPQADDALADIRRLRRIITGLWLFKKLNVSGTGNRPNTRMLDMFNRLHTKLQRAASRYRAAYNALLVLDPNGSWREHLKELNAADIRGPGRDVDDPEDTKKSKGRFEPSWIWLVPRSSSERREDQTEDEFNDSMRAEWAQTRARKCRWSEEFLIIQEEMRRVLAYHEWRAEWWLEQASRRQNADPSVLSGISAYAQKEASICLHMAARCATYWLPIMRKHGVTWIEKYKLLEPQISLTGGEPELESELESGDEENNGELDQVDEQSDSGSVDVEYIIDFD